MAHAGVLIKDSHPFGLPEKLTAAHIPVAYEACVPELEVHQGLWVSRPYLGGT